MSTRERKRHGSDNGGYVASEATVAEAMAAEPRRRRLAAEVTASEATDGGLRWQ